MSTAAERWREELEAWAIPRALIDAAPESPYGFPAELFRRRAAGAASSRADSPSTLRALDALSSGGTVVDVGSGGGSMSLPLAVRASHLTAVDGQADMLAAFAEAARTAGVGASTILGRWPDVAGEAPAADVVTCGHVAYNVADLGPFVSALDAHAGRRVVMELTDRHPLAWMNDLWFTFHGVMRPDGPTDADAIDVIRDLVSRSGARRAPSRTRRPTAGSSVVRTRSRSCGAASACRRTATTRSPRHSASACVSERACGPPGRTNRPS